MRGMRPAAAHEALDGERSRNGVAQPDAASGGDAMQEGGDTADDADGLLPKGMLLEEMIAVIDARRDGSSGGETETDGEEPENAEWARQRVLQAGTVEEIAAAAGAPVLAEVPGLDLEDARAAALLKLDGWTPADRERRPPGLHGDGPILLHLGEEVSYADEGARRVAFAPRTSGRKTARTARSRCATVSRWT